MKEVCIHNCKIPSTSPNKFSRWKQNLHSTSGACIHHTTTHLSRNISFSQSTHVGEWGTRTARFRQDNVNCALFSEASLRVARAALVCRTRRNSKPTDIRKEWSYRPCRSNGGPRANWRDVHTQSRISRLLLQQLVFYAPLPQQTQISVSNRLHGRQCSSSSSSLSVSVSLRHWRHFPTRVKLDVHELLELCSLEQSTKVSFQYRKELTNRMCREEEGWCTLCRETKTS